MTALRILTAAMLNAAEQRFPTDQDAAARYVADMLYDWANESTGPK